MNRLCVYFVLMGLVRSRWRVLRRPRVSPKQRSTGDIATGATFCRLALSRLASPAPLDPQTEPPDRLRWLIRHAVETVEDGVGLGGVAAMLTDEDPEFNALFRQILVEQRAHLASAIDASKADGSMRADIHSATLIDAVVGAYIAEHARSGSIANGWEERLFDLFWPAVQPTQPPAT